MIIFYDKTTGEVQGIVLGRTITADHEKIVSIGDKTNSEKIRCDWKPVAWYDKNMKKVDPIKEEKKVYYTDIEPDHEQKEEFSTFDKDPMKAYNYKVDVKTKKLVKKL